MRVLVTGGTGFVGSHAAGHDLRLFVRAPERVGAALAPVGLRSGLEVVEGEVTDEAAQCPREEVDAGVLRPEAE